MAATRKRGGIPSQDFVPAQSKTYTGWSDDPKLATTSKATFSQTDVTTNKSFPIPVREDGHGEFFSVSHSAGSKYTSMVPKQKTKPTPEMVSRWQEE